MQNAVYMGSLHSKCLHATFFKWQRDEKIMIKSLKIEIIKHYEHSYFKVRKIDFIPIGTCNINKMKNSIVPDFPYFPTNIIKT